MRVMDVQCGTTTLITFINTNFRVQEGDGDNFYRSSYEMDISKKKINMYDAARAVRERPASRYQWYNRS